MFKVYTCILNFVIIIVFRSAEASSFFYLLYDTLRLSLFPPDFLPLKRSNHFNFDSKCGTNDLSFAYEMFGTSKNLMGHL